MSALDAGYDVRASGVTLDRFCGSGITSVNMAASSIMSGSEDLVIAGGTEMMSTCKAIARQRAAVQMDNGNLHLRARAPADRTRASAPMRSRRSKASPAAHSTSSALESQQRAEAAIKDGHFDKSLVPVYRDDGSARARPRGIPAAADDDRGACRR